MTENELLVAITVGTPGRRGLCPELGLWWYHSYDSTRSSPGWPDLVILSRRGILFRELKTEDATLTFEQRRVGVLLKPAGQSWEVWRPSDLFAGIIERQLRRIALPAWTT